MKKVNEKARHHQKMTKSDQTDCPTFLVWVDGQGMSFSVENPLIQVNFLFVNITKQQVEILEGLAEEE